MFRDRVEMHSSKYMSREILKTFDSHLIQKSIFQTGI